MTTGVHPEMQAANIGTRWAAVRRQLDRFGWLVLIPSIVVGLAGVSGLEFRQVDILAQFVGPACVATMAVALVLAVAGFRRSLWVALGACALLFLAAWPQWFPDGPRPQASAPTMRLYSANVFYLNADVAAIRRSIEAADPDVIVLIELNSQAVAQVDTLLEGYPYRGASFSLDETQGPSRTLIASRWPLKPLGEAPGYLHAIAAQAETPFGPVNIVATHLTRPWPFRNSWGQISQAQVLDQFVGGMSGPVVVAGDFNSVSSARIGKQVRRDLGLHAAPGFPGTWPSNLPSAVGMTIDQVYASKDLAFAGRTVGRDNGSDHRPVVTEITRAAR